MRAGLLRHRGNVLRPTGAVDALGQPTGATSGRGTLWLELLDAGGTETIAAAQVHGEVSAVLETRAPADVRPRDVLELPDLGRSLEVVAVLDPEGRSRRLRIIAREAVD